MRLDLVAAGIGDGDGQAAGFEGRVQLCVVPKAEVDRLDQLILSDGRLAIRPARRKDEAGQVVSENGLARRNVGLPQVGRTIGGRRGRHIIRDADDLDRSQTTPFRLRRALHGPCLPFGVDQGQRLQKCERFLMPEGDRRF